MQGDGTAVGETLVVVLNKRPTGAAVDASF